eukprot:1615162-Rhodomonas_salina.1
MEACSDDLSLSWHTVEPPLTPKIAAECLIPGSSLAPTPPPPRMMKMSIGVCVVVHLPVEVPRA